MRYLLIIVSLLLVLSQHRVVLAGELDKNRYPEWVAEQLSLLKEGLSLGQWKKNRPAEPIMLFSHNDPGPPIMRNWCARAEYRLDLGNDIVAVRYAFFYPPNAPESLILPTKTEASSLVDKYCILGLIWTERGEQVTELGQELARNVRTAIDNRFGHGLAGAEMNFSGSGFWSETGRWQVHSGTIASSYAERTYDRNKSKVLAFAFLPNSELFVDMSPPQRRYIYDESDTPKAHAKAMISQSGISGNEKELMLEVIGDIEASFKETSQEKKKQYRLKFTSALKQWISSAQKLDPSHRSAALLAADQLLQMSAYPLGIVNPAAGKFARKELKKLGAEFKYSMLDRDYLYTNSWLHQARRLDRVGPAGRLAYRLHLQKQFGKGYCEGYYEFMEIIRKGEQYLRQENDLANIIAVELMVADAYRDIVALAKGSDPNVNAEYYADLSHEARNKAIMHYRKALVNTKFTDKTKTAWGGAWRLIAGITPHFNYCWRD